MTLMTILILNSMQIDKPHYGIVKQDKVFKVKTF